MSEYIPCTSFGDWATSFRMVSSSSINLSENFKIPFFPHRVVSHYVNVPNLLYPFFSWGHLCCFQVLPITNNASMNIVKQISLLQGCGSFGYMYKSEVASDSLILIFLQICHSDLQNVHTSLQSHQQCRSVYLSLILSSLSFNCCS